MAAVRTSSEIGFNRVAIVAVLLVTIIFLAPIYWIASTAFKPRNLATTIPSAPGYIGTFDAPGIAVLTAYGVPLSTAAGYTLVLHVALWLPITLLGVYFLAQEGIKWNESLRAEANDV